MTWAAAAVLIVLISAVAGVMRARSRTRFDATPDNAESERQAASDRERELQSELVDLRERIKILERIATDANSTETREAKTIADEIERLRDT